MTLATYRSISLGLSLIFGAVGLLFLFFSSHVLLAFDELSALVAMRPSGTDAHGFYVALAVAYMYVVTLLAWHMYRNPENRVFPQLLFNAKFASSIVSLFLFLDTPFLIYLVNGVVDGFIGVAVFAMRRGIGRESR